MRSSDREVSRRGILAGAAQAAVAGATLGRYHRSALARDSHAPLPHLNTSDYVIWDAHGHLTAPGRTPRERMANLLKIADRMGIERVIVFMGFPWSYDPDPDDMRRQNDQVLEAVAHSGGRALGFVYLNPKHTDASLSEIGIRALRAAKNVCVDICGGDPTAGFVEMAVRELGPRRVIYGSDYAGRSFASQLAKVFGADIPESSKRLILAGNIKRLLAPICAAKEFSLE